MKLFNFTPYTTATTTGVGQADKDQTVPDVGKAYNEYMGLLKPNQWANLMDHDIFWPAKDWYRRILAHVKKAPGNAGALVCLTNRIGCPWQIAKDVDPDNHDTRYHMLVAQRVAQENDGQQIDVTDWDGIPVENTLPLSGLLITTPRSAWEKVKGFMHGFLGVDNDYHERLRKAGLKVFLMADVYCYHGYRVEAPDTSAATPGAGGDDKSLYFENELLPPAPVRVKEAQR